MNPGVSLSPWVAHGSRRVSPRLSPLLCGFCGVNVHVMHRFLKHGRRRVLPSIISLVWVLRGEYA